MIDLDDLLAALIVEDQNQIPDVLERLGRTGWFFASTVAGQLVFSTRHPPFLPPAAASSLLENIRQSAPQSEALPTSTDMGLSPALKETLAAASDLKKMLESKRLTPLHLLAALLAGSHERVQALRDAGITEEKVLDVIRREDQT